MAVPEFDLIKAPALQLLADGQARRIPDIETALADHFSLNAQARSELLPSGAERRWHNRVSWACYDLYRAGLLERVRRGTYQISPTGREVAASKPQLVDRAYLMQFAPFAEWIRSAGQVVQEKPSGGPASSGAVAGPQTPEETIDIAYVSLRAKLVVELLDIVRNVDPYRFEQIVLDVLLAMGYGGSREEAASLTKASHDEGIDGIINEDRLGLDTIYVQAKRWKDSVGRKEIQSFVGALAGKKANKGVFITTGKFADTAQPYVGSLSQKVILIDGARLAELMIEYSIGVSLLRTYELKRVDADYFEE